MPSPVTYISEFPHPRLIILYDPYPDSYDADTVRRPLRGRASAIELPLRLGKRGVVVAHDTAHSGSPTLAQMIQHVLDWKGPSATVLNDDRQFFLILALKQKSHAFHLGIVEQLALFQSYLSTAVTSDDRYRPRCLTVLITGHTTEFYNDLKGPGLNRLCIVEGIDYSQEPNPIRNLSPDRPFQWTAYSWDAISGKVNANHLGSSQFNVRAWYTDDYLGDADLQFTLATGADAVNVRPDNFDLFKAVILSQRPRGYAPWLALCGSQALLAWAGASDNNYLYAAPGSMEARGLLFPRQINLNAFLKERPLAFAPAAALGADGQVIIVYEGTSEQRLWYVSGRFTSPDHFITFDGGPHGAQHQLESAHGVTPHGSFPAVAIGPSGQVIIVYQGTDDHRLFYVTGAFDAAGQVIGQEFELTQGDARRGYTPTVAIDSTGHVIIVYEGTDDSRLFYVSGTLDQAGQVQGQEFKLTEGSARRGHTPSVAFDAHGRVIIAYEGTDNHRLFYVSGWLGDSGQIDGQEFELTTGDARRGMRPTVAFDGKGNAVIFYLGTDGLKFFYVQGPVDGQGQLMGVEHLLDMALDRT